MAKKKQTNIFDDGSVRDYADPFFALFGTLALAVTSLSGLLVGGLIDENFVPLDDTPRKGQQEALAQYSTMLGELSEKYDALQAAKQTLPTNTSNTPETMQEYTGTSTSNQEIEWKISRLHTSFTALSDDFAVSALVDPRLNEQDTHDLFQTFQKQSGGLEVGRTDPDFGDLNYCRTNNLTDIKDESAEAYSIDSCTNRTPISSLAMAGAYTGGILPLLIFLGFLGKEWTQSKRGFVPTRKRFKH